jgi:hypothetical protein
VLVAIDWSRRAGDQVYGKNKSRRIAEAMQRAAGKIVINT